MDNEEYRLTIRSSGNRNCSNIDYPVFNYICEKYKVKNMLDIGCGLGAMVDYALKNGINATGIDGDKTLDIFNRSEFIFHDYTEGPLNIDSVYDLGWCVEFLEHVEEQYLDNVFLTFSGCKVLCCTHALPGQGGYGHFNEQPPRYWLDIFDKYDFEFKLRESFHFRKISDMKEVGQDSLKFKTMEDYKNAYMKRTGMFFVNRKFDLC